ncbi:NADH dehydrogenase [Thermoanaerobacterium thermosaccharolyticum]|uniref:4Fe-4S dicluster domain-containing protein n=1 Tax=Thermoanaerobacterium thermosaccharolyticum TaxID=1517 RepID=UPI000C072D00|nr:4Fe-4S dicluster domain-containing protein [Thermoanaerobacterium thermosaccharolyticum]PHO07200.1 NADH dehydrogenase [Thermoanaerobacterium thermosaccharolyticum]
MDIDELKNIVFENGIIGAGGAGFPTHAKLTTGIDTIILNGAECEPLLRVDRQLLAIYTDEILMTLSFIVDTLGAKRGIVAIKSAYKIAIDSVKNSIGNYKNLELKMLPDVYPAGDEVVLIYETTGRIVPEGSIPISVGTIVMNVETVLNIYNAINLKHPVTEKYVTVTGNVKYPSTFKVKVGTSAAELIEKAGGCLEEDYEVIMGGPMTGKIVDVETPITKITKAIIVLPKDHPVITKRKTNIRVELKRAMSVCSQCQMCTDLCPRHLLGHSIEPHKVMNAVANNIIADTTAYTMTMLCSECGLCEMYSCHQSLSPRKIISQIKTKLRQNGVKNPHNKRTERANVMRDERLVPMERLISRLSLKKYDVDAPMNFDTVIPSHHVVMQLSQHVGVKAIPVVNVGDIVKEGDLIGDVPNNKLGAKLHASIDGIIIDVTDDRIVIKPRGDFDGQSNRIS